MEPAHPAAAAPGMLQKSGTGTPIGLTGERPPVKTQ